MPGNGNGYIRIYRKLLDNPITTKPKYLAVWMYLLLHTNFKDNTFIWNNEKVTVRRGQLITSISGIADHFNMSTGTVSYILDYLVSENMIEKSSNYSFTLITINNYDEYQKVESQSESGLKANRKRIESGLKQINNDNKEKNVRGELRKCADELVDYWNTNHQRKFKTPKEGAWLTNFRKWLDTYSLEEIKQAVDVAQTKHHFYKDKINPDMLFRSHEDRIGAMLNYGVRSKLTPKDLV